jgi:4a-hydroxytetrahydrobiopterin dehydratase
MATPARLDQAEINQRLKGLNDWRQEEDALVRVIRFPEYRDALEYVYQVGQASEREDHHPDITMNYATVTVKYSTHKSAGITELDFHMAGLVDEIARRMTQAKA